MIPVPVSSWSNAEEMYTHLERTLASLLDGELDLIANMANMAAMLGHTLPLINWAGFYRYQGDELVLGPFWGKPACLRIGMGKGVCGTAATQRSTVIVDDVNAFPGHIACDAASRSEIVVPLVKGARLLGVLDVDSPIEGRFTSVDRHGLERIAEILVDGSEW